MSALRITARGDRIEATKSSSVFVGTSLEDELIPQSAYAELIESLGGPAVEVARWPGGHLAPLFDPSVVMPRLEAFDRLVRDR